MKELREIEETDLVLEESKNKNILRNLRFNYVRAEKLNANNRVYPESVISKDAERFNDALKKSGISGQLNHPKINSTELDKISHVLTGISYNPKTRLGVAEAVILNTTKGRDLLTLINSNVKLGASMRGFGTVAANRRVNDDFKLMSIDLVENPSFGSDTLISKSNLIESGNLAFEEFDEENELTLDKLGLSEKELDETIKEINEMTDQEFDALGENDLSKEEALEELEKLRGKGLSGKKSLEQLQKEHNLLKEKLKNLENKKSDKQETLTEQIEQARLEFQSLMKPRNKILEEKLMEKNKEKELRQAYIEARTWGFLKEGETFEQFCEKMLEAERNLQPEFERMNEAREQETKKITEELERSGRTIEENIAYEEAVFGGFAGNFTEWKEAMKRGKKNLEERRKMEEAEPITVAELIEQTHEKAKKELEEELTEKGQLKFYHHDLKNSIFEGSFVEWIQWKKMKEKETLKREQERYPTI